MAINNQKHTLKRLSNKEENNRQQTYLLVELSPEKVQTLSSLDDYKKKKIHFDRIHVSDTNSAKKIEI